MILATERLLLRRFVEQDWRTVDCTLACRPHPRIGPHFSSSLPATLGHGQRRGAAVVDAGCGGGYIAKRFPPGVRDGDKGHLEGWGAARRARGVARSGLFVEVGSRYRLRRTERGSRSSGCGDSKKFSGVKAVDGVDLKILPGEVRMMAGENGAGGYTSIKIFLQVERPTEGEVGIPGERVTFYGPGYARSSGRAII